MTEHHPTQSPTNTVEMVATLFDFAKQQGFSIALLLSFAYWAHGRMERMENKVDNCQTEKIELLRSQNEDLKQVIESNTAAFKEFSQSQNTRRK